MRNFISVSLIAIIAFTLALVVGAPVAMALPGPDAQNVTVTADVQEALTLTVGANISYTITPVMLAAGGQDTSKTTLLTVSTNNPNGYLINQKIGGSLTSGADVIINSSNAAAPGNDNYFGFKTGGAGNAATKFELLDTAIVGFTGGGPANGVQHTVNYDLNVDYSTKAHADYTATITYTAVAIP